MNYLESTQDVINDFMKRIDLRLNRIKRALWKSASQPQPTNLRSKGPKT